MRWPFMPADSLIEGAVKGRRFFEGAEMKKALKGPVIDDDALLYGFSS